MMSPAPLSLANALAAPTYFLRKVGVAPYHSRPFSSSLQSSAERSLTPSSLSESNASKQRRSNILHLPPAAAAASAATPPNSAGLTFAATKAGLRIPREMRAYKESDGTHRSRHGHQPLLHKSSGSK